MGSWRGLDGALFRGRHLLGLRARCTDEPRPNDAEPQRMLSLAASDRPQLSLDAVPNGKKGARPIELSVPDDKDGWQVPRGR